MYSCIRYVGYSIALLVASIQPPATVVPTAQRPWYRGSRALNVTGANPRDSMVLVATGTRADSLSMVMTFFVSGTAVHRQRWTSADELYDVDSLLAFPAKLTPFMRARLDTVLALVKRQPINREQVSHMGDEAALRKVVPRPTHQIMLSFGFENSLFLAWDPTRRRLFVFMECC